jgi:hypothetical protein
VPYIRFTRDRRGYEHTCIVHASRRRGRKEARVLYWFRTPPNVKVGRAPIDEDAIRAIEHHNPDLAFDWTRILEARPTLPPEPPARMARRPRRESSRGSRDAPIRPTSPSLAEPEPQAEVEPLPPELELSSGPEPLPEPEVLSEAEVGSLLEPDPLPLPESARPVPAEELVGTEGLARLRALYAELQARITERAADPARTEELRREAERLNPDAWVTLDEARQALEQYEIVSETFRRALGRRRRSRRGGARRNRRREAGGTEESAPSESPVSEPADE